jgi:hypothetical protein
VRTSLAALCATAPVLTAAGCANLPATTTAAAVTPAAPAAEIAAQLQATAWQTVQSFKQPI